MTVKIMFADGSKQMAHNLDDCNERWALRVEAEVIEQEKAPDRTDLELFVPPIEWPLIGREAISSVKEGVQVKIKFIYHLLHTRRLERAQAHAQSNPCHGSTKLDKPMIEALEKLKLQSGYLTRLLGIEGAMAGLMSSYPGKRAERLCRLEKAVLDMAQEEKMLSDAGLLIMPVEARFEEMAEV